MKLRTIILPLLMAVIAGYLIWNRPWKGKSTMVEPPRDIDSMSPSANPSQKPASFSRTAPGLSQLEQEPANLVERMRKGLALPMLTAVQLQSYLDQNRRSAGSLLAAYWGSGDKGFFQEAREKYPKDPRVNLVVISTTAPTSPERRSLLESFKQSDPHNSLGNYLLARDYFKAGEADKALAELTAGTGNRVFTDYSTEFIQDSEEAWRAAGYSEAEARMVAAASLRIDPLVEVKRLGEDLANLARGYQQAGDASSVETILRIGAALGNQLDQPSVTGLLRNLAGLRIESQVLAVLPPTTPYDDSGQTVADRLAVIAQRRGQLLSLSNAGVNAQQTMSDDDLVTFYERAKALGAENSIRWAVSRQTTSTEHN